MSTGGPAISVVVADDEALVRGGIILLLNVASHIRVVGEAADGAQAVRLTRRLRPDVVLMDLRMPGTDGIEATRQLTAISDGGDQLVKVLVLTTFNDDESLFGAVRAGASGFLVKDNAPDHLVPAVMSLAHGDHWIDPSVGGQVFRALRTLPTAPGPSQTRTSSLTPREHEILTLMATGLTNSEIGRHYVLSEATVRTHVSRILMKTGAHDRTQAVVIAYQAGIVTPGC